MAETNGNGSNYITNKELLLEIRAEQSAQRALLHSLDLRYTQELSQRPTRREIISWLGAVGVLSGMIFGFIAALGG